MIRDWHCPECGKTDRTQDDGTGTRYHVCPKMRGLSVPMVLAGVKARLVLKEREDYVGRELVQLDPERRRPVQSISTEREDGNDLIIYAPTASRGIARSLPWQTRRSTRRSPRPKRLLLPSRMRPQSASGGASGGWMKPSNG